VTGQVEEIYAMQDRLTFDDKWHSAQFMGHEKDEGNFVPETEQDKKLFIANGMAAKIRAAIASSLNYDASAGISHNKTVAKISASVNKPNGQTVVPARYLLLAMSGVPIRSVRWLGGKVGKSLIENGYKMMGDLQGVKVDEIAEVVGNDTANWIIKLANGICDEDVTEKAAPKTAGA